jgi:hypothetical protein
MPIEASCCVGARVEGRAREGCGEVRWRPRAVLTFYRWPGGDGEAVTRAVTSTINVLRH